jgi:ADP-ribosylglycohydrolase
MRSSQSTVNSALWAAYGDALGFITELADGAILLQRIGSNEVYKTLPWRRRLGGRFGVTIELPAGCYSDDTQLRLATGRAILPSGTFDVEAFAKIELPVWLSYALGGGKGTKSAARALARRNSHWFANLFGSGQPGSYFQNGGNGAAMRIQPHVWSASSLNRPEQYLRDVIRNSVCTHGHPRGILGAVFHAVSLAQALEDLRSPRPEEWRQAVKTFALAAEMIRSDEELAMYWLPGWERQFEVSVEDAFSTTATECLQDIEVIEGHLAVGGIDKYPQMVEAVGGLSPESRGSGTKTAILSSALAWLAASEPQRGLLRAANLLGSDTDTIASLAGAILGATASVPPDGPILDRKYIAAEAERLWSVSQRRSSPGFRYPDLLRWTAPTSQVDAVGEVNGRLAVAGLGFVKSTGQTIEQPGKNPMLWQWVELEFGQSVLLRRKSRVHVLDPGALPTQTPTVPPKPSPEAQAELFARREASRNDAARPSTHRGIDLDSLSHRVIERRFEPTLIGRILVHLFEQENGIELSIAFAAIIAKAWRARHSREARPAAGSANAAGEGRSDVGNSAPSNVNRPPVNTSISLGNPQSEESPNTR